MISVIGGLFMICASYAMYRGNAYLSIILFSIADICWVVQSIISGNIFGSVVIGVAIIFGVLTFLRMRQGTFNKTLKI